MFRTDRPSAGPCSWVRWNPRRLVAVAGGIAVVLMASLVCAQVLQHSTRTYWDDPSLFELRVSLVDLAVLSTLLVCVWSILGRLWWSVALVAGGVLALAAGNRQKTGLRLEPVYPSDRDFLTEPGFLLSMVDSRDVFDGVLVVVVVVAVLAAIGWAAGRWLPRRRVRRADGRIDPWFLEVRLIVFALTAGLLAHATDFNEPRNLWRSLYEAGGESWRPWSQLQNYRDNGFVAGFLYNMPAVPMDRPEGYDAEAMAEIADRYSERAARINADRSGSIEDANVVFVLSESFTDPAWMEGFTLERNPIPRTQDLMSETIAGTVYAQMYGGGTATMEFESLTGQPIGLFRPQISSPYQMFVADQAAYPSAVGAFGALGHRTVAIHPFNLHMYRRTRVYETFGFDEVVYEATMRSRTRVGRSHYISDAAAFDEVLHQLDRATEPLFVNLVTMQNHGSYGDFYPNPIGSDIPDAQKAAEIGQYAAGLEHSDRALASFLQDLRAREEPTVVVFYGDHHPGVYSQEILDAGDEAAFHRTPFFVWSSESNEAERIEAITPALFLPLVYEAADAPVPPYVALLDEVRRSFGVLQHARMLDAAGRPFVEEDLGRPARHLLEDLRLVQYDFSIGERYAVEALWPGALG